MTKSNRSNILEIHGGDAVEVLKALALEARMEIVQMLATGSKNINELGTALGLSQPTITKHIQQLEQAGLVESEYMPGVQGMQKRCRLRYDRLIVSFDNPIEAEDRIEEINMPIGLYTLANPAVRAHDGNLLGSPKPQRRLAKRYHRMGQRSRTRHLDLAR